MNILIGFVKYIVKRSSELKNAYTDASSAAVEFSCIFCQNEEEFKQFTYSIETMGKVVERTQSGFTYLLGKPIATVAGPVWLIKIRKPDSRRIERGDADFNTDYKRFKMLYENDPKFELIKRPEFEMLRLSDPDFDVMACFSSIPKSKLLGIVLE